MANDDDIQDRNEDQTVAEIEAGRLQDSTTSVGDSFPETDEPTDSDESSSDIAPLGDKGESNEDVPKKRKKKRHPVVRFLRGIFFTVFGIILLVVLLVGVFLGIALLDRRNPTDALPSGFDAYIRVESAGELLLKTLDLEVADIMLTSPNLAGIRGALTGLREQEIMRGRLFSRASDIRVDAAMYGDQYLLVGDLGGRSALTRMASPFFRFTDFLRIRELEYREGGGPVHFVIEGDDSSYYFALRKNLLIASTSLPILYQAIEGIDFHERDAELDAALSQESEGDLRILANPLTFLSGMQEENEGVSRMLSLMEFSRYATVDLTVTNETIALNATVPVSTEDPGLDALIGDRSAAPAIFNSLPESTSYASIVSAGTPEELMNVISPLAGPDFSEALEKADKASNSALGMGVDELVFSWTGSEMGLFGLESYPEPVFFIRVENERKRKEVFDEILGSFLISGDDETVIDDVRLTRISFPWYIRLVLEALEIELPEPYFAMGDDFLFLSVSGEAVAKTVASIDSKELLIRTDEWEKSGGRVPASAALGVVYSLDRSIPFFLQGRGAAADALRLYRQGVATLRFDGGDLKISLAAVASGGKGVMAMPGFPVKTEDRLRSSTRALSIPAGGDRLYWLEGDDTLVEYDASTGSRLSAGLDDQARIAVGDGTVWVVSRRGNVYAFEPGLEALPGFPEATPYIASADPVVTGGVMALPEREEKTIVFFSPDGERSILPLSFEDPLVSPPSFRDGIWAAYPKGFLASLYLFDSDGIAVEGWPVPVDQIAYGSPVFVDDGESYLVAFLSQAGSLTYYDPAGNVVSSMLLDGVFYTNPVWAAGTGALYALSEEGTLFKVSPDGDIDRADIDGLKGKEGILSLMDVQGDMNEELFVSEAGAAIYGFTSDLFPLEGFPLPGGREPAFADLNGDGRVDLITGGYDNTIRAYSFR